MTIPCVECKGSGETIIRGCEHQGNCPCGLDKAFPCPRCEGSKVEPCDFCGEPSTHLLYASHYEPTQAVCDACDPDPALRDHPMGGMGYGISYDQSLAEARKLK